MAARKMLCGSIVYMILMLTTLTCASVRSRRHLAPACPSECRCSLDKDSAGAVHCTSFTFLNKLSAKESSHIIALNLSNASLHALDKRLKNIFNLERLNLSYNKIAEVAHLQHLKKLSHLNLRSNVIVSFSAKHLPDSLEYLDVSHNLIKELPLDLQLLQSLKRIDVAGNPFSCNRDSLESRDMLLERKVQVVGRALCHDPIKFRGKPWLNVVDFDEYFKLHEQDNMVADQVDGSGESEGSGAHIHLESSTIVGSVHDFFFEGSGSEDASPPPEEGSGAVPPEPFFNESIPFDVKDKEVETETTTVDPKLGSLEKGSVQKNLGTTIFLVVFLLCLAALLVYAIKKNKDKKRELKRKAHRAADKPSAACIELLPKQNLLNEKQNGNPESMPLMNGQNGNTTDGAPAGEESALADMPQPDTEPDESSGVSVVASAGAAVAPPPSPNITSVKVRAAEIPESVLRTPIVVTRSRSSDGKHIVVTPSLAKKA